MATTFDFKNLERSLEFGEFYASIEASVGGTISSSDNLQSQRIFIQQNCSLTEFQQSVIDSLFYEFKKIEDEIDPERLKFSVGATADNELLLYRQTANGLTNLVIDEDDYITYSFIHKEQGDILTFYSRSKKNLDFEVVALNFLSR